MLTAMAVGAGIGAFGSLANTGLSFGLNQYSSKKAAKKAYEYWRRSQLEGPSLARQGLEKAGYNPMLALSQGASSFGQGVSAPNTQVGDFVGSARQGAELAKEAVKSAKASIKNIEADTALKLGQLDAVETQRLQTEANTALLHSQTERSDLAYGRDIVGTAADIAGTAGSLYSAKAMSDVAKANAAINARNATVNEKRLNQHKFEVLRDKNGHKVSTRESIQSSRGVPTVQSTPNAKTPNVGGLGHSAKSVGKVASDLAKMVVLPAALGGLAAEGVKPFVGEVKKQSRKDIERNSRKSPIQVPYKRPIAIRFGM